MMNAFFDLAEYEDGYDGFPQAVKWIFVSFSGGKDSVASFLRVREQYPAHIIKLVFTDTGDEAKETYDYLRYFDAKVHPVIRLATRLDSDDTDTGGTRHFSRVRIPIDTPLDVMRANCYTVYDAIIDKHKRFQMAGRNLTPYPNLSARHCTRDLKVSALNAYITAQVPRAERNLSVRVIGIRRGESVRRSKQRMFGFDYDANLHDWYPIVNFDISDVWAIHAKYGVKRNPVYDIDKRSNCIGCVFNKPSNVKAHIKRHGASVVDGWVKVERQTGYKLWGELGVTDLLDDSADVDILADNPLFGCNSGYCDV